MKLKTAIYSLCSLGLVLCTSSLVAAQQFGGVNLNRYRPAELATDGFAISRPDDIGHLRWGAQLHLDYANDPLVFETVQGDAESETAQIVNDQFAAHAVLALGLFDRLVVYAGMPVNIIMDGDSEDQLFGLPEADGFSVGDLYVGGRLRLLGDNDDLASLSLQATINLPIQEWVDGAQAYASEKSISGHPELLFELRPWGLKLTANVGVLIRDQIDLGAVDLQHELTYGLGVTVPVYDNKFRVELLAEAFGSTNFESFAGREESPLEALGGVKMHTKSGFTAGFAGGPGLSRGYGSPDYRLILMAAYQTPAEVEKKPALAPVDGDRDGDGIMDSVDQCPDDPEDKDGFEDEDGCPDLDNDQDGIPDVDDKCPNDAEDKDGFEDEDGCPDPDNDQDTVLDVDDECPLAPGKPEDKGCPKSVRIDTEKGQIVILERVEFATNKDVILKRSLPILEEVSATIKANPQLLKIRVEGHTDDRGRNKYNMDLSARRARSVVRWLLDNQLPKERVDAVGCGEERPIADNKKKKGRQTNRRVEFHIIEGNADPGVCQAIDIDAAR